MFMTFFNLLLQFLQKLRVVSESATLSLTNPLRRTEQCGNILLAWWCWWKRRRSLCFRLTAAAVARHHRGGNASKQQSRRKFSQKQYRYGTLLHL